MEYIFLPTGTKVSVADGRKLPATLYEPVKPARKKRTATKKAAKKEA